VSTRRDRLGPGRATDAAGRIVPWIAAVDSTIRLDRDRLDAPHVLARLGVE